MPIGWDSIFLRRLSGRRRSRLLGRAAGKIAPFVDLIHHFRKVCANEGLSALLQEIITETGYVEELKVEGTDEAQARIENIDELITKVVSYEQETDEPTLGVDF